MQACATILNGWVLTSMLIIRQIWKTGNVSCVNPFSWRKTQDRQGTEMLAPYGAAAAAFGAD